MAILRNKQRRSYTVIDNTVFRDSELSNKALGMLCRMLSLPDGWEFSVRGLAKLSNDGVDGVMSQLNELEKHGYLMRTQRRDKGKLAGVEYIVSEVKMDGEPIVEKPHQEKPYTVKPHQEKPSQSNNKQLNTKVSTTKEIDIYKPEKITKKQIAAEFDDLWGLYPRKQGKDKAMSYYEKARKSGTTYDEVKAGILAYRAYIDAEQTESRFIKHGSTFFSQKAWLDDWSIQPRSTGNPFLDLLSEGGL